MHNGWKVCKCVHDTTDLYLATPTKLLIRQSSQRTENLHNAAYISFHRQTLTLPSFMGAITFRMDYLIS